MGGLPAGDQKSSAAGDALGNDLLSTLGPLPESTGFVLSGDFPVGVDDFLESVHGSSIGWVIGH